MGNTLFIAAGRIHFIQIPLLRSKINNEGYHFYVVGPQNSSSDIEYDFNPGSFIQCLKSNFISVIEDKIIEYNIRVIYVSDLNFPLYNLICSSSLVRKNKIEILFYYDGLINIISSKLTKSDKFKDLLKYLCARLYFKKYTVRKRLFNGSDLGISVYYDFEQIVSTFKLSFLELSNIKSELNNESSLCLYLSQGHQSIEKKYNFYLRETLSLLKFMYPNLEIKILARPNYPSKKISEFEYVERLFPTESAEEVCFRLKPKVVVSANSSSLLNLKLLDYPCEIISFNLKKMYDYFPENGYSEIESLFKSYNIKFIK